MQLGKSRLPRHSGRLRMEASLFCCLQDAHASDASPDNHLNSRSALLVSTAGVVDSKRSDD